MKEQSTTPFEWRRAPRRDHDLGCERGLYALFLRDHGSLAGLSKSDSGLIYIGRAAGAKGLAGRCHFGGRTRNHSPRKSLAFLLMNELDLNPVRVDRGRAGPTWGLDPPSERNLSDWMHANLDLAVELCESPAERESQLIARHAPPLNLTKCFQTTWHHRISEGRIWIRASVCGVAEAGRQRFVRPPRPAPDPVRSSMADQVPAGDVIDTAKDMARRYRLDPKALRAALRREISWYRKPQRWSVPVGSREHENMEAIARRLSGRL